MLKSVKYCSNIWSVLFFTIHLFRNQIIKYKDMNARKFKEQNVVFAENQEEYLDLPALIDTEEGTATFSFKLTEDEIKQVVETGTIYLTTLTFNKPLQPIGMSLLNPFIS